MAIDLSMQLDELQKSANELNALTDKANDIVRRTEIFLTNTCRVGGCTEVPIYPLDDDDEADSETTLQNWLVYERFDGEFRILVTLTEEDKLRDKKPWAECSREMKLRAINSLPKLIDELLKKVRKRVSDAQASVQLLDSTIPAAGETQPRASRSRKG